MIAYWVLFLFIVLLVFFSSFLNRDSRVFSISIIVFVLIAFAGFRGDIDGDYWAYIDKYHDSAKGLDDGTVEYSFILISKASKYLFNSFNGVLFSYAAIALMLLYFFVLFKSKVDPFIFLVYFSFYYYLHPMTQIRAAIASICVLYSIQYISDKNPYKFILFVFLGSFFHVSALLILPFYYLLSFVEISRLKIFIALFLSLMLSILFQNLPALIEPFITGNTYIATKILMHIQTMNGGLGSRTAFIYVLISICKILLVFFLYPYVNRLEGSDSKIFIYLKLYLIANVFYISFSSFHIVAARVSELFCICEIALIPIACRLFNPQWFGRILIVLFSIFQFLITIHLVGLMKPYYINF